MTYYAKAPQCQVVKQGSRVQSRSRKQDILGEVHSSQFKEIRGQVQGETHVFDKSMHNMRKDLLLRVNAIKGSIRSLEMGVQEHEIERMLEMGEL